MKNFNQLPKNWANLDRAKSELQKKLPNWDNPQTFLEIQELQNLIPKPIPKLTNPTKSY